MLFTPHFLLGAVIVSAVPDLRISIPLAFASHFVLDAIPHWQASLKPWVITKKATAISILDLVLGITLLKIYGGTNLIWLGGLLGVLPDLDIILYVKRFRKFISHPYLKKWTSFHENIQNETASYWGLLPQFLIVLICLNYLK